MERTARTDEQPAVMAEGESAGEDPVTSEPITEEMAAAIADGLENEPDDQDDDVTTTTLHAAEVAVLAQSIAADESTKQRRARKQ